MGYGVTGLSDISAYLWEKEYNGIYNGKKRDPDVREVLSRAWDYGLENILVVGKTYVSSKKSLMLARTDRRLYCTVGCHPSKYYQLKRRERDYADHLAGLIEYSKKKCVAVGDFGLDFREEGLSICEKKYQLKYFDLHLQYGYILERRLLFHYQGDAFEDMILSLTNRKYEGKLKGVCHSFQGSLVEARELTRKGFYIGIDGCSLKEKRNLEVVKHLPLNRLLLGTNSPHCSVIRPHAGLRHLRTDFFPSKKQCSYEGMIFGRTEPFHVNHLLEIVASTRGMELQELADIVQMNFKKLFFPKKPKKVPALIV